jgi:hypothetical protein
MFDHARSEGFHIYRQDLLKDLGGEFLGEKRKSETMEPFTFDSNGLGQGILTEGEKNQYG